jgi:hypothetical protein
VIIDMRLLNLHIKVPFHCMCLFLAVFVMTAADPHESSYACYYDDQRQTYLGDVFSVMWMQDSEKVWPSHASSLICGKFVSMICMTPWKMCYEYQEGCPMGCTI